LVHASIASQGTGEASQSEHGGEKAHSSASISEIQRLLGVGKTPLLSSDLHSGALLSYGHAKTDKCLLGHVCIIAAEGAVQYTVATRQCRDG
jgi:hypothetical protein